MKTAQETTIFLVEDDKVFRAKLSEYLSTTFGYRIETYNTGEECLRCLTNRTDIVLLDYYLLKQTGLDILRKIKNFRPELQVLSVSAQRDANTTLEIMESGAYGELSKNENVFEEIAEKITEMRNVIYEKQALHKETIGLGVAFLLSIAVGLYQALLHLS